MIYHRNNRASNSQSEQLNNLRWSEELANMADNILKTETSTIFNLCFATHRFDKVEKIETSYFLDDYNSVKNVRSSFNRALNISKNDFMRIVRNSKTEGFGCAFGFVHTNHLTSFTRIHNDVNSNLIICIFGQSSDYEKNNGLDVANAELLPQSEDLTSKFYPHFYVIYVCLSMGLLTHILFFAYERKLKFLIHK